MEDLKLPVDAPSVRLQAGDYFVRQWTLRTHKTGAPLNFAGYALTASWRNGKDADVALAVSSPESGVLRVEGIAEGMGGTAGRIFVRGVREGRPQTFVRAPVVLVGDGLRGSS